MAKLAVGVNDLATVNPKLAAEWNSENNGTLKPQDVTKSSGRKVWWRHVLSDGSVHEWQATIASRSDGHGCPFCSNIRVLPGFNDLATINPELAAEWSPLKNGVLKPSDVLSGSNKKIWWRCSKGHEWQATVSSRIEGRGCPYCANKRVLTGFNDLATTNPKLADEWDYAKNGELTPKDVAAGSNKKAWWKCRSCGTEWYASINNRSRGAGCPECSHPSKRKSHERYVAELAQKNPDIEVVGKYLSITHPVKCKCKRCGNVWYPNAGSVLNSAHGCPVCWDMRRHLPRKTETEFVEQLNRINPLISLVSEYKSSKDRVRCRCEVCGHEWTVIPGALLAGNGCPHCNHSQTSFVEQCLYETMCLRLGEHSVISRDRDTVGSELDILIPDMKLAFEYGAWFWHEKRLDRDIKKRNECARRGIRLIECYDAFPSGKEPPFQTDCLTYRQSLGLFANREYLLEYLNLCLKYVDELPLKQAELSIAISKGYRNSRRKTTEQFAAELLVINPDIEVVGGYESSSSKNEVRCRKCGNTWHVRPNNLLRGASCPICQLKVNAANRTFSQEKFEQRLAIANPNVYLVGPFRKTSLPVKVRCKICGHTWTASGSNLLSGSGCPKCSGRIHEKIVCLETGSCFDTFAAAANWCGLKGCGGISVACKSKGGYAGGYHWVFAAEDDYSNACNCS